MFYTHALYIPLTMRMIRQSLSMVSKVATSKVSSSTLNRATTLRQLVLLLHVQLIVVPTHIYQHYCQVSCYRYETLDS